ncbi:MAG TPA: MoaD/ThiS family protein [Planctomycetota bacterium]|jgi:molybdopterin converting factor small subunit
MPCLNLRYHALLREKTSCAGETLSLPGAEARVADVRAAFAEKYPSAARLAPLLHFAVNNQIVGADAVVRDHDTIDLMPPFGGG